MVSIIPLSVGQRRLDTGNAVQYPQGSPIGGAMQGLGEHLSAVAERYQQMKDQQEAFDAELERRRFSGQIAQAEDEVAANAPADGAGLHEAMYGLVDPRNGRVVKTGLFDTLFAAALPNMPESQRAAFAGQKEAMRAVGARRMGLRQLQQRRDYELAQVDTALTTSAIGIRNANPDDHISFEAARQQGLDLIDKTGVDPGIRQQMVKDWFGTSAKARFEALIAKDPERALEMFGVGKPAASSEGNGGHAADGAFAVGPKMAPGKDDRVGVQTPDERIAQAFRDDLPKQEQDALALKAKAAKFARDVDLRVSIARAEAEAPDRIARTGSYPDGMPGKEAYRIIYGRDEGDRRRKVFEWRADVGKKIFDMATMSNQAIDAVVVNAEPGPNASPADHEHYEATDAAAKLVREKRRVGAGGYVSELSPEIAGGLKAVFGTGLTDPGVNGQGTYDQDIYDRTIELSVAQQKALGIADENLQPVPLSYLLKIAEDRDSQGSFAADNYAKVKKLFERTKGPVARAALARELDDAGLGGILPGGRPPLSTGEMLRSEVKALAKVVANAGIGAAEYAAKVGSVAPLGSTQPTLSPPDFSGAYYEPSNYFERAMMRQGNDALSWAIPMPVFGRVAKNGMPRAVEPIGSAAAGRAEVPIGTKPLARPEGTNTSIPETVPGRVEKVGAGQGAAANTPAKLMPESLYRQSTTPVAGKDGVQAIESAGIRAVAQAKGNSNAPNASIPKGALGQGVAGKAGDLRPAGEGIAPLPASKRKPDFFRQPTSSLDDLYAVAPKWQADLEGAGQQIADQVGAKFVTNGAKLRETAYEKIDRNKYKDASRLIDLVRISFIVKTPQQADEIVTRLAQHYAIRDGKWFGKPNDYFDRKITVRFGDGMLGEVQLLEPNMYKAKVELGGQDLYTATRHLDEGDAKISDLREQEAALYATARHHVGPVWRELLAKLVGSSSNNSK